MAVVVRLGGGGKAMSSLSRRVGTVTVGAALVVCSFALAAQASTPSHLYLTQNGTVVPVGSKMAVTFYFEEGKCKFAAHGVIATNGKLTDKFTMTEQEPSCENGIILRGGVKSVTINHKGIEKIKMLQGTQVIQGECVWQVKELQGGEIVPGYLNNSTRVDGNREPLPGSPSICYQAPPIEGSEHYEPEYFMELR